MKKDDKRSVVLSVDPGGTTGWVTWKQVGEKHPLGIRSSGEHPFEEFVMLADDIAHRLRVIVCERYTITARTVRMSQQTTALEVIGFLKYLTVREHIEMVIQPTSAKTFASDAKLRAAGWYVPGKGHANDAKRHLLTYLVKEQLMEVPR